jgi:hypothetical protein
VCQKWQSKCLNLHYGRVLQGLNLVFQLWIFGLSSSIAAYMYCGDDIQAFFKKIVTRDVNLHL